MKRIIGFLARKNKGPIQDPPFSFKLVLMVFFFLIFISFAAEDNFAQKNENNINIKNFSLNEKDENVFLSPARFFEESSDLIVSQLSTIYASSPSYFPKNQILGVNSSAEEKREIFSYTVQSGDSLSSVADRFNISQNTIIWANELQKTSLSVGQELIILPVTGILHSGSSGTILKDIASKYKADIKDIVEFNELSEGQERIDIRDILVVPGGEMPAQAPASIRSYASNFIPPALGYISQGLHPNNAVDIANNCGTPIYASAAGTVNATGSSWVGGNYVRISHSGGVVTYYGHLSRITVSRGQSVSQGQIIGYMGNTGFTIGPTGCHVHFEVRGATNPFGAYPRWYRFR